ncbi:hypothetical protein IGI53_002763 [Enterococcus sp. DIV0788_1]
MRIDNLLKSNSLLYVGIVFIILNAIFLNFNFFINILGLALILFSTDITKIINNFLKDNR